MAEIVEKKNEYVEKLALYREILDGSGGSPCPPELMQIVDEINSIQETNLLLTKQSLSYQNILLESISKVIQNTSNTYSAKGSYKKVNNISLIDQEV